MKLFLYQQRSSLSLWFLLATSLLVVGVNASSTNATTSMLRGDHHHDLLTLSQELKTKHSPSVSSSSSTIPSVNIATDVHGRAVNLPMVGAGTWQYNNTVARESVCKAFQEGYTLVDTAFIYHNQFGVGVAIRECWKQPRENLFVLTKLPGGLTPKQVHATHAFNLMRLGLDYVDHLMVHFPADWDGKTGASKQVRQQSWLAMESIYYAGKARSIGVSHYCKQHLEDILEVATVMPSLNQVEYHVGSQDVDEVMDFCQEHGIQFMSFSPLCGPCEYNDVHDSLINGTLVSEVATHYEHVTPSQVALRYIVQQGIPVIPKSRSSHHMQSNKDLFGFELTPHDMDQLVNADQPAPVAGDCDIA